VLSNAAMVKTCESIRRRKINQWLYRWIDDVIKFKIGMTLKQASAVYQKRFKDKLMPEEEQDENVQQYAVMNYVVQDHDFFAGLDYESIAFEGEGPGAIMLKFTGDRAGKNSKLDQRLYYLYFSTTKFTDQHNYTDVGRSSTSSFNFMASQRPL
jgi:hypothetical protein